MKTIYTDKTGLIPWVYTVVGTLFIATNSAGLIREFNWLDVLGCLAGLGFYGLALHRFLQVRRAKAEGRDHTIVRIKNAPDR